MMNVKLREQVDLEARVLNMDENETRYDTVELTTCYVIRKCIKCGRLRDFYCADPDFNYCDKCGRRIIEGDVRNGNGINHKINGDIKLRAEVSE